MIDISNECTLPTAERPLRATEIHDLFAAALTRLTRTGPTHLRMHLDPELETTVRDLVARESGCCSFFDFTVGLTDNGLLQLDVQVPAPYSEVIDELAALASAASGVAMSAYAVPNSPEPRLEPTRCEQDGADSRP